MSRFMFPFFPLLPIILNYVKNQSVGSATYLNFLFNKLLKMEVFHILKTFIVKLIVYFL